MQKTKVLVELKKAPIAEEWESREQNPANTWHNPERCIILQFICCIPSFYIIPLTGNYQSHLLVLEYYFCVSNGAILFFLINLTKDIGPNCVFCSKLLQNT